MGAKTPSATDVVVGMEELKRLDVLVELGKVAAAALASNGIVVFYRHPDGTICIADPTKVYLDVGAIASLDEAKQQPRFKWIRPIVGVEKPTYVAWRGSELWEIELEGDQVEDLRTAPEEGSPTGPRTSG